MTANIITTGGETPDWNTARQTDGLGYSMEAAGATAADAQAARARAIVQARAIMAIQRPRDYDVARVKLLASCRRPTFAGAAWYEIKNRGSGFTIRFVEEAIRFLGNIMSEVTTTYDDERKRIVHVEVVDIENNSSFARDLTIEKSVERKSANGRKILGTRKNSYGDDVYILEATDDEVAVKESAMVSKAVRTLSERHIPADIREDCRAAIAATRGNEAAKDPEGERKKIIDGFAALRVMPSDLETYLGHPLAQVTPSEIVDLKSVWMALRDGTATWQDVLEGAREETAKMADGQANATDSGGAAPPKAKRARRGAAGLAERVVEQPQAAVPATPEPAPKPASAPPAAAPQPAPAPGGTLFGTPSKDAAAGEEQRVRQNLLGAFRTGHAASKTAGAANPYDQVKDFHLWNAWQSGHDQTPYNVATEVADFMSGGEIPGGGEVEP